MRGKKVKKLKKLTGNPNPSRKHEGAFKQWKPQRKSESIAQENLPTKDT